MGKKFPLRDAPMVILAVVLHSATLRKEGRSRLGLTRVLKYLLTAREFARVVKGRHAISPSFHIKGASIYDVRKYLGFFYLQV